MIVTFSALWVSVLGMKMFYVVFVSLGIGGCFFGLSSCGVSDKVSDSWLLEKAVERHEKAINDARRNRPGGTYFPESYDEILE